MIAQTISHYRVHSKLGEGGMGVVYRAEDLKLGRPVALKFIAPHLVSDEQTKKRFLREAMAVASLDHPNIATVFEIDEADGSLFLAMSLVEGSTLHDLIAERPFKLADLLDVALQTAGALRAAHAQGVVHRDVKPGNLIVSRQGQVKVMDFGLAQLTAPLRTTQTVLTEAATIGTPAYMSPEQAQGRPTDQRTDIWSLGVVMYEMATGALPFTAHEAVAVFHAILNHAPEPVTARRAGLPLELDRIIAKCLAKDPADRYQHIDDLMVDLAQLRKTIESGVASSQAVHHATPQSRSLAIRNFVLMATVVAVAVASTWLVSRRFQRAPEVVRPHTVKFTFTPERLRRGSGVDIDVEVAVSPDGRHIAYVESAGGQLWVRDIDQEQARPVPGATSVLQAFWSADSRFIAYADGGELKRISAQGGTPTTVVKLAGNFRGGTWSENGQTILYADTTGMYTVAAAGGSATRILEHRHLEQPSFLQLPDGRPAFLFQVLNVSPYHEIQYLIAGDEKPQTIYTPTSSNPYPSYSSTGHILYVDGNGASLAIWALPFSLSERRATGKPFPIAQRASSPRLSRTGTLVYSDAPVDVFQLAWCDRSGKVLSTVGSPQFYTDPALSPDGRRLAVNVMEGGRDMWIYDLDRSTMTRFTFESKRPRTPAWSPSGGDIVYSNLNGDHFDLYAKRSNGDGEPRVIVSTAANEFAPTWSPDHRFLVYESAGDLLYRARGSDGELGEPMVFLQTRFIEATPSFSADGKYLAYASNETGRREVYVRPFPPGDSKSRVSLNGGTAPRWRRDGKEIFYVAGDQLMAVSVTTQPTLSLGTPASLFGKSIGTLVDLNNNPQYDVASDGTRIILRDRLANERPLAVHVVHNWFEEFRGGS